MTRPPERVTFTGAEFNACVYDARVARNVLAFRFEDNITNLGKRGPKWEVSINQTVGVFFCAQEHRSMRSRERFAEGFLVDQTPEVAHTLLVHI